jgi:hypothetical protein
LAASFIGFSTHQTEKGDRKKLTLFVLPAWSHEYAFAMLTRLGYAMNVV